MIKGISIATEALSTSRLRDEYLLDMLENDLYKKHAELQLIALAPIAPHLKEDAQNLVSDLMKHIRGLTFPWEPKEDIKEKKKVSDDIQGAMDIYLKMEEQGAVTSRAK